MSEELSEKEKFDASRLLLAGFLSEIIGGGTTFLIILIIGYVEPFLAAFLIILVAAGATLGCGLIMVWLGNPFNLYWRKAKDVYEDVKDGSVDTIATTEKKPCPLEGKLIVKGNVIQKIDGTPFTDKEIKLIQAKQLSDSLEEAKVKTDEQKEELIKEIIANGDVKTTETVEKKE